MRFGIVILPQHDWPDAARYWRGAEELGFDHAWTYDHLSWRSLAGERWHATVPTLTAAAMATERIRLGTFVASPNYRHPVPFAKEVATLDQIAGGRLTLGLGSGGTGFDATVLGQGLLSPRERVDRFTAFAEGLDVLLRGEAGQGAESGAGSSATGAGISFENDWFSARGARMVGRPAQRPRVPFLMAGNGPRGMRLAARLGQGWVTTGPDGASGEEWWRGVAALNAGMSEITAGAGAGFARSLSLDSGGQFALQSLGSFEDAVGRAAELGFTDVMVHWPRADGIHAGSEAVLEEAASRLPALRDA